MKAELTFSIDDDEEMEKLQLQLKATDMLRALQDVKDLLRSWDKYGIPEHAKRNILSPLTNPETSGYIEVADVVELLRKEINTIIYERVGEI